MATSLVLGSQDQEIRLVLAYKVQVLVLASLQFYFHSETELKSALDDQCMQPNLTTTINQKFFALGIKTKGICINVAMHIFRNGSKSKPKC